MPFLDKAGFHQLLEGAQNGVHWCPWCRAYIAADYCRTCDQFYAMHRPECPRLEDVHYGHRLTIIPFVEVR